MTKNAHKSSRWTALLAAAAGAFGFTFSAAAADKSQAQECCAIVELRQYLLYPGKRDELISLFEQRFIESQENVGIRVVGQFRDVNDAHRFTWVRGFPSMEARKQALTDFYFGPLWQTYRNQANATLYDNDDVLLLHPASPGSGFMLNPQERPPIGATGSRPGFVVATLYHFAHEVSPDFIAKFDGQLMPLFERAGAHTLARYVTDKSKNTFERLPVRENENIFVWFAGFADRQAYDRYIDKLAQDARWRDQLFGELYKSLKRPPETLMLTPTARSLVH